MNAADLISLIEPLARRFFGEPHHRPSATELGFGSNGWLKVDLARGTWPDLEANIGGNALDLIKREEGCASDADCFEWLETEGYIGGGKTDGVDSRPAAHPASSGDDKADAGAATDSAGRGEAAEAAANSAAIQLLAKTRAAFRKWLDEDYDIDVIDAVLATGASERLSGDPLWLLFVSGSGFGKTELVQSLAGAGAHVTSTIASEGALLSATPRKEKTKGATGGLLRKIGDRGILVIKDVTSILSADRNTRGVVLAALREIHDGKYERNVGTDGGRTLTWIGRITVVGAVTTAWDAAHAVVAACGDRFVLIRADSTTGRDKAAKNPSVTLATKRSCARSWHKSSVGCSATLARTNINSAMPRPISWSRPPTS